MSYDWQTTARAVWETVDVFDHTTGTATAVFSNALIFVNLSI